MIQILLATQNKNKIYEIKKIFLNNTIALFSISDFPQLHALQFDEYGKTLEENATLKCKQTMDAIRKANLPDVPEFVASEDSGLFVDALQGGPGVHSARYAGPNATDHQNNEKLLHALRNITHRKAEFRTVVCLYNTSNHGCSYFTGAMKGTIAYDARGKEGFGYDPLFIPTGYRSTLAQMGTLEKNLISHRFQAWKALSDEIKKSFLIG